MSRPRSLLLVVPLLTALLVGPARTASGDLADLDAYVTAAMQEWQVPGLAIAVVQDGEVVLARGYGLRDVEGNRPVTADTLFAIGSISKSFTTALLGMLVDEGKLQWDEPLRTYLTDLQLHDPVATAGITARDLLCHRSGLARHDLVWYASGLSRDELYRRLRFLTPSHEFRAVWQYQNLMFLTAGVLAERIEDRSWEELIRARLFEPLGMRRSTLSVEDSVKDPDHALPYALLDEQVRRVPFRNIDAVGPAGSINSCVSEMIAYVQLLIDQGRHGDRQLLSTANAQEMQRPQMVMPVGPVTDERIGPGTYGLGLMISTYRGHRMIQHGGGIDGFISLLSFLPAEKCGAIVLTNFSGKNPVPTVVTRGLYDRLLGLEPVDWIASTKEQQAKAEEAAKEKQEPARREGTRPTHELAEYAGHYVHPAYGAVTITVTTDGAGLMFEMHGLPSVLAHHHYDIFRVVEHKDRVDPFGDRLVTFAYDKEGRIDRLAIPFEDGVEDLVFAREGSDSADGESDDPTVATRADVLRPQPIVCAAPAHWSLEANPSAMRLAQYTVSAEPPVQCIVYHFGVGGGGGVQANVDRWLAQFEDDVQSTVTEHDPADGVHVTLVDATGTYAAEVRPGAGERLQEPDWRMLAAIVEIEQGPLYLKMVGPAAVIDAEQDGFRAWALSFRPSN